MCTKTKSVSDALQALQNAARYGMSPGFHNGQHGSVITISNGCAVFCDHKPVIILNKQGTKFICTFDTAVGAVNHLRSLFHYDGC